MESYVSSYIKKTKNKKHILFVYLSLLLQLQTSERESNSLTLALMSFQHYFPSQPPQFFFFFLSSTLASVSVPYQKCLVGLKSEFTEKRPPNYSSKLRLNLWGIKKTNQVVQNLKAKKQTKLVLSSFKVIKYSLIRLFQILLSLNT